MEQENFHPERFNVDTTGMRQLHGSRQPEQLVKELVQNVFDEAATRCDVTIRVEEQGVRVVVEDDGPGFRDVRDAYTLMGDTAKRLDPEKRGRFNMGEKEMLCMALWARVETTGATIEFPESGGRMVRKNRKRKGTRVTAMMPWGEEEARRLERRMKAIRPPGGIEYRVNRRRVLGERELKVHSAVLDTLIQENPGEPIRPTRRKTDIHILKAEGEKGWIYEMGIPIQETDLEFSVDVMQKVPMPPNRDTVSESYLNRVYTEVLNAMHQEMEEQQFSENWVRTAMENRVVETDAVKSVIQNRYGDKVVTWSSNTDANMKATDAGYQVLHPRSLGKNELRNMRELGELKSSHDIFGKRENEETIYLDDRDEARDNFAEWVRELGRMAGKEVIVRFIRDEETREMASCTMNTENPEMRFNTFHLDQDFFRGRGPGQLELVIHELGHSETRGRMSHGAQWGEACCRVGTAIAMQTALRPGEILPGG